MNFRHVKLDELNFDMKSETTEKGRVYKTPNGELYPSITTVLSSYNKKAIMEWRKRVGDEEANRVSRFASGRGNKLHNAVEKYILNEMTDIKMKTLMPDIKEMFSDIRKVVDESIGTIYGIEQPLYSHKLRLAGRCDCIAEWDGELAIVDWKTSKRLKEKENIKNYFMQATAYALMFEEITGIPINKIVVVIAVENENVQIFVEDKTKYIISLNEYNDKYPR
jgi:ATP-dependent exoDNAse (exonuclease V) beta subunit